MSIVSEKLHLGCGKTILEGWVNLDRAVLPGVDVVADMDCCATQPLPFPDNIFKEILGRHVIQCIRNPLPLFQELHRIARPLATATFVLPYGSSDDAFEDPTHVRQYFLRSFAYFSQPYYWRADYGYRGDWLVEKICLQVSTAYRGKNPGEILADVMKLRNVVQEMTVRLLAIKPIREARKELQVAPIIEFQYI